MHPSSTSEPFDRSAYVVRSTTPALDGRVTYALVDLAGNLTHVTIPRHLTLSELADPILRHHVALGRRWGR